MAAVLPKRRVSDAENRLRLLFCVHALGMVTREQLWPFVAMLDLMEYVPMCLFVNELLADGSLAESACAAAQVLTATEKGRGALALFTNRMPRSDRERILRAAPGYAASLRERRLVRAVHELAAEGFYRVGCYVTEDELPLLCLRVQSRRRSETAAAMKRFRACAPRLMELLYTLPLPCGEGADIPVLGDLSQAMDEVRPQSPLLCAFGKYEHAGVVCLSGQRAEYRLALRMPSAQEAARWAAAVLLQSDALWSRVYALLGGGGGKR